MATRISDKSHTGDRQHEVAIKEIKERLLFYIEMQKSNIKLQERIVKKDPVTEQNQTVLAYLSPYNLEGKGLEVIASFIDTNSTLIEKITDQAIIDELSGALLDLLREQFRVINLLEPDVSSKMKKAFFKLLDEKFTSVNICFFRETIISFLQKQVVQPSGDLVHNYAEITQSLLEICENQSLKTKVLEHVLPHPSASFENGLVGLLSYVSESSAEVLESSSGPLESSQTFLAPLTPILEKHIEDIKSAGIFNPLFKEIARQFSQLFFSDDMDKVTQESSESYVELIFFGLRQVKGFENNYLETLEEITLRHGQINYIDLSMIRTLEDIERSRMEGFIRALVDRLKRRHGNERALSPLFLMCFIDGIGLSINTGKDHLSVFFVMQSCFDSIFILLTQPMIDSICSSLSNKFPGEGKEGTKLTLDALSVFVHHYDDISRMSLDCRKIMLTVNTIINEISFQHVEEAQYHQLFFLLRSIFNFNFGETTIELVSEKMFKGFMRIFLLINQDCLMEMNESQRSRYLIRIHTTIYNSITGSKRIDPNLSPFEALLGIIMIMKMSKKSLEQTQTKLPNIRLMRPLFQEVLEMVRLDEQQRRTKREGLFFDESPHRKLSQSRINGDFHLNRRSPNGHRR